MKSSIAGTISLFALACSVAQAFASKQPVVKSAGYLTARSAALQEINSLRGGGGRATLFATKAGASTPQGKIPSSSGSRSKISVLQGLTFFFVLSSSLTALAPPPALVAKLGADKATTLLSMVSGAGALTEIMFATALGSVIIGPGASQRCC
jgi:hypothetical protein